MEQNSFTIFFFFRSLFQPTNRERVFQRRIFIVIFILFFQYQQQFYTHISHITHRMLSARPVLRNAVRSAAVAARSSARVVCIEFCQWVNGRDRKFSNSR